MSPTEETITFGAIKHNKVVADYYPGLGDGGVINPYTLEYYPGIDPEGGVVNPYTGEYYVGDGAGGAINPKAFRIRP